MLMSDGQTFNPTTCIACLGFWVIWVGRDEAAASKCLLFTFLVKIHVEPGFQLARGG